MIETVFGTIIKEHYCIFCWKRICAFCLAAALLTAVIAAADYSLDYAAISIGDGERQTTDYEVIGLLKADGVDGQIQASADYSVTSTTGLKEDQQTRVDDWMLY